MAASPGDGAAEEVRQGIIGASGWFPLALPLYVPLQYAALLGQSLESARALEMASPANAHVEVLLFGTHTRSLQFRFGLAQFQAHNAQLQAVHLSRIRWQSAGNDRLTRGHAAEVPSPPDLDKRVHVVDATLRLGGVSACLQEDVPARHHLVRVRQAARPHVLPTPPTNL